ncbi:APA family basic amino acid/polyamine antiporter [Actinoalloteichus hoggarensis]|uniref:Putative amino acid permease YhdG n=1 Tax=Actinoalloteichus hoggarensis TaxID=1470176 RepID=A0A221W2H3_9PSEU|nr:APC family permease [Actinoalloteichus hoggarensis]ASO20030.1 putative amino acid permease YhdG [Actinoalloteichus hoggarensis]MBB5919259.1 APA family basic amino acid/polyamine antiporter [Actinoalloteichus hoggarensis]
MNSPSPDREPTDAEQPDGGLRRRLGTGDAVFVGLGAMLGAGVFTAFSPAAGAAGSLLLPALALAGLVAVCNAISSARLAARYPVAGGTYVYGRERLGPFWGYLAGWCFVIGKTASCAAMALTVGLYLWPAQARPVAAVTLLALTALSMFGVRRALWFTRIAVVAVLLVLALVVIAAIWGEPGPAAVTPGAATAASPGGLLEAAGLLFFAFAGYARITTLGEEVRDPRRTIGLAVPIALGITLLVYLALASALLAGVGADAIATWSDPLASVVAASDLAVAAPLVRAGAVLAAGAALSALLLGVSRTVLAMARDRRLPGVLAAVDARHGVPLRAELAVGVVAAVAVLSADLREVIGFSSFGVLVYYAIANAAAWTLSRAEHRPPRALTAVGLTCCVLLAVSLPIRSVVGGIVLIALGVLGWLFLTWSTRRRNGTINPHSTSGELIQEPGQGAANG